MARGKKKAKQTEKILDTVESVSEDLESEPDTADDVAEASLEEATEEEESPKPKPKTKRQSRPRRPRAPRAARKQPIEAGSLLAAMSKLEDSTGEAPAPQREEEAEVISSALETAAEAFSPKADELAPTQAAAAFESKPVPTVRYEAAVLSGYESNPQQKAEPTRFNEAIAVTSHLERSMATFAKQIERVNTVLIDFSESKEKANSAKQPPWVSIAAMRPAPITKVAVGMSALAIILSFISLSLSQSAREKALERVEPRVTEKFVAPAVTPSTVAQSVPKESEPRWKPPVRYPTPRLAYANRPRVTRRKATPSIAQRPARRSKR